MAYVLPYDSQHADCPITPSPNIPHALGAQEGAYLLWAAKLARISHVNHIRSTAPALQYMGVEVSPCTACERPSRKMHAVRGHDL